MNFQGFIPLLATVLGAIIALGGAFWSTIVIERRREKRQAKNLASAFYGEITALRSIVEKRNYVDGLKQIISVMKTTGNPLQYDVPIEMRYFNVWKENVSNIGILEDPLPADIAIFYTQCNSVLEDFKAIRDGVLDGSDVGALIGFYNNLLELLNDTLRLGEKILSRIAERYRLSVRDGNSIE